jgi:hypothetical protein
VAAGCYDLINDTKDDMAIETIGHYQLHLIAYEVSGTGLWDPFVTIFRFDDDAGDFKCVLEKHHASDKPLPSHEEAIEVARRIGTALVEAGNL